MLAVGRQKVIKTRDFMKYLEKGITLIELTVVLLILIALAGVVTPYVSGTGRMAMCKATDATMQAVKEAIMGGGAGPGFYGDTLGYYPKDTKDTDLTNINLKYLFSKPAGFSNYNPKTAVGWRGPYLLSGGAVRDTLHPSYNDVAKVHVAVDASDPVINDAWGRPIIIQVPTVCAGHPDPSDCARLVSAGPGSGIKAIEAIIDTTIGDSRTYDTDHGISSNDDRILYLQMPMPASDQNTLCNE